MDADHSPTSASRGYGGISAAERRTQRRAALLETALDLLAEAGAHAVTKRAVCARARLNDRYFYEQFTDTDALIRVLGEDLTAQGLQAAMAATLTAGPDIRTQIHAGVAASFDFLLSEPRRSALLRESHTNDVLFRSRVRTQHAIAKTIVAVRGDLTAEPEADQQDGEMTAYVVIAGVFELISAWFRGEFDTTKEQMVELVTRMLMESSVQTNHS